MRKPTKISQPKKEIEKSDEVPGLPNHVRTLTNGCRFQYVHYPFGWEFVDDPSVLADGNGWLPVLSKINGVAGANGVSEEGPPGKKRLNMSRAVAASREKGGNVIEPDDERLGPYKYYVGSYELRDGGKFFVDQFQEATVLPNDTVLWNSDKVAPEWNKFRAYLRDNLLDPMMSQVYELKMDVERQLLTSLEDRAAGSERALLGRVERQRKRIAAMEAAYTAWSATWAEDVQPAAKSPRKRRETEAADQ